MPQDDLISLKDDMVAFIEGHGMRRIPAFVSEEVPSVQWDDDDNADSWKDFVEAAKHAGSAFLTMSEAALDAEELQELVAELQAHTFPDEEGPELDEARALAPHTGKIGYLQLGFAYQGVMFLHEHSTEWYDRYQQLLEALEEYSDIVFEEGEDDEA